MITPEYLEEIIEGTQREVTYMQTQILRKMCDRIYASFIHKEDNILIPTTINEIHQLMDSGMMREEIQEIVEKALPDIQDEIKKAFLQSAKEISDYNTDIAKKIIETYDKRGNPIDVEIPQYEKVGIPKTAAGLNMTADEIKKLEQIYKRTRKYVDNLCHTLPELGNEEYIDITNKAFLRQRAGEPIGLVIKDAIKEASAKGIKFVSYDSGHVDTIEVAIARAVRSGINKANAEIVLTRAGEMGAGHVLVSEHMGARVTKEDDYTNHAWWQGQVYKLDWNNEILKKYDVYVPKEEKGFKWLRKMKEANKKTEIKVKFPDFVETCGYGQLLGICGVNCRHTFSMFFPEVQSIPERRVNDEKNERFYNMTQKQRDMERAIRKTKTELYNLNDKTGPEIEERRNFLLNLQERQMDRYTEFIDKNGQKLDDWRLQIYRGDNIVKKKNSKVLIEERRMIEKYESPKAFGIIGKKKHTKEEFTEMSKAVNKMLDTYIETESKWSGIINITNKISGTGQKDWDCSITLKKYSTIQDVIHENIHARTTSYITKVEYLENRNFEEATVENFTEELCKKYNYKIARTYVEEVDKIIEINKIGKFYESNFDFSLKMASMILNERYQWVIVESNKKLVNGSITEKEYDKIMDMLSFLCGGI